jgi:hypothetical protein
LAATFKHKAALNFPDMINIRNEAVVEKYAFGLNWLKGNMRMNEGTNGLLHKLVAFCSYNNCRSLVSRLLPEGIYLQNVQSKTYTHHSIAIKTYLNCAISFGF